MSLISVVVPVYWNEKSLPVLHNELAAIAAEHPAHTFEFVFTDDGSGDGSFRVLSELAAADSRVRVLRLSRNFGSNPAILAGLTHCSGDCAVVISADLQDPPSLIPQMLESWQRGNQAVLAARRSRQDPLLSRFFATAFNRLFRRFVFSDFPANGFDFMLLDRQIIDIVSELQEKNSYIFGQVMWVGFQREVIEYDRLEREHGQSMWTFTKKIKYFIDAFSSFSYLPLRIASVMGFALAFLGFLYAIAAIVLRLASQTPVTGWTSLLVAILVISGTQLILIGLLGEYLWRVLDETRKRPAFIVRSKLNFDEK